MPRVLSAFVVVNATYAEVEQLQNPVNDAEDIARSLGELGFSVQTLLNATTEAMERGLLAFGATLSSSDVGLFFFAGHAFQIDGDNLLAGIDTRANDHLAVKYSALYLDKVVDTMKRASQSSERASIIILDACRNNPFEGLRRSVASNELAPVFAPKGMILAFSTSPGEKSRDGLGRNGPYTEALLNHIRTSDLPIETMFKRVRNTLATLTGGRQTSGEHTSLLGDFHFRLSREAPVLEYARTSIADGLFVIRDSQLGHAIVRGLKILTFSYQNDAIGNLNAEVTNACTADTLFVMGRNIYQAACGGSNGAYAFIDRFMEKTELYLEEKRKNLLDGILFEIFFDAEGRHRSNPKARWFNNAFRLQEYFEMGSSFSFIADCLEPYRDDYYSIPGSDQAVSIDIAAEDPLGGEAYVVSAVWLEGTNILRVSEAASANSWFIRDRTFNPEDVQTYLSEELMIPRRLLTVVPNFHETTRSTYTFLSQYSLKKH